MRTSETINELAASLAKAQGEIKHALKDSTNPHYKSKYADLASVISVAKEALSKHGLSVVQGLSAQLDQQQLICTTRLLHSSGQWIESELALRPTKPDPQGYGSAATYARRYALAAMLGIAQDDDDGNLASQPASEVKPKEEAPKKKVTIYEGTPDQIRVVSELCVSRGLTDDEIKKVHEKLLGKPSTELYRTIADVRGDNDE